MVEVSARRRAGHALVLLINHDLGGLLRDAFVAEDTPTVLGKLTRGNGALTFRRVSGQTAATRVAASLVLSADIGPGELVDEDVFDLQPLIEARLRALPVPVADEARPQLADAARWELVDDFLQSPEATNLEDADFAAKTIVDFRMDYGDGRPLRWSPHLVDHFMCDWIPRKITAHDGFASVLPDVLRGWIGYAGRRSGLAPRHVLQILKAVKRCEPEFQRAWRDTSRYGPAKTVALAMMRDGVDVTDEAAANAWIKRNPRPWNELVQFPTLAGSAGA